MTQLSKDSRDEEDGEANPTLDEDLSISHHSIWDGCKISVLSECKIAAGIAIHGEQISRFLICWHSFSFYFPCSSFYKYL